MRGLELTFSVHGATVWMIGMIACISHVSSMIGDANGQVHLAILMEDLLRR